MAAYAGADNLRHCVGFRVLNLYTYLHGVCYYKMRMGTNVDLTSAADYLPQTFIQLELHSLRNNSTGGTSRRAAVGTKSGPTRHRNAFATNPHPNQSLPLAAIDPSTTVRFKLLALHHSCGKTARKSSDVNKTSLCGN